MRCSKLVLSNDNEHSFKKKTNVSRKTSIVYVDQQYSTTKSLTYVKSVKSYRSQIASFCLVIDDKICIRDPTPWCFGVKLPNGNLLIILGFG